MDGCDRERSHSPQSSDRHEIKGGEGREKISGGKLPPGKTEETNMSTFERVVKILVEAKDRDDEQIKMESTWADLELDSLDTVELVMNLEDEFGIQLEMNENLKTVGDVVEAIDAQLA